MYFDSCYYRDFLLARRDEIVGFLKEFSQQLCDYENYCRSQELIVDQNVVSLLNQLDQIARDMLAKMNSVGTSPTSTVEERQDDVFEKYHVYRSLLFLKMTLGSLLDWRSASYSQSRHSMFFYGKNIANTGVNYNRYESHLLNRLEKSMKAVLDFGDDVDLLMTSSGMAAYNLFESFALRHILTPGDTIYVPHYIYFEIAEQLQTLKEYCVVKTDTTDADEIVQHIFQYRPKLVFLDAMNNNLELRLTDIERVLRGLDNYDQPIHLLVDGTMLSGMLKPFQQTTNPNVKVFYLESCSKYLQMGQDIAMAGLLVCPREFSENMLRLRRNTGAILYDTAVLTFPIFSREEHLQRMRRMTTNALLVSELVNSRSEVSQKVKANYPLLPEHPDYQLAKRLENIGGIVTFTFLEPHMQERACLNDLITRIIDLAKTQKISIVHGVSFGFSIPRISASAAMAESKYPFLRLSIGDVDPGYAKRVGEVVAQAMASEGVY